MLLILKLRQRDILSAVLLKISLDAVKKKLKIKPNIYTIELCSVSSIQTMQYWLVGLENGGISNQNRYDLKSMKKKPDT